MDQNHDYISGTTKSIRADFESDWEKRNHLKYTIPFVKVIESNNDFKEALFREFAALRAKPKEDLYIADLMDLKALSKELQNQNIPVKQRRNDGVIVAADFVPDGPLESKWHDLRNGFYKLVAKQKVPIKYFGRYITETKTVKILRKIEKDLNEFRDFIYRNPNIEQDAEHAKIVAGVIIDQAEIITISGLGKCTIQAIIDDDDHIRMLILSSHRGLTEQQRSEAHKRYGDLKKYFHAALKEKLHNTVAKQVYMTQGSYIDILLTGYVNHRAYFPEFIYREYKNAQEKHIGFDEFFKRLLEAMNTFIYEIKNKRYEELSKWSIAKSQMQNEGTWTEELEKASKLEGMEFSVHLHSLTNGKYAGHLFASDLQFINNAITKAIEIIEAENKPNKHLNSSSVSNEDIAEPALYPKMILLALWIRDGRISDEEKIEKKRAAYLQTIAKIKGTSNRNDFTEFKQYATGILGDGQSKTFEKYISDLHQPKYKELLRKHNLL